MNKPPTSFWVIAVLALVWAIVSMYLATYEMDSKAANLSAEEFAVTQSLPAWYAFVFVGAIISEVVGCFLMIIRKKLAVFFFGISLITLICMEIYWLFSIDVTRLSFVVAIAVPIIAIAIDAFLFIYSRYAVRKGWLS